MVQRLSNIYMDTKEQVNSVDKRCPKMIFAKMKIGDTELTLQLDCGATVIF